MYPSHSPDAAATIGGYVPYFYQSGLHQAYPLPSMNVPRPADDSRSSSYDPAPAESIFGRADRIQSVEQVIANGYFAIPLGDPVAAIISDKRGTSWLGLDDVISQIRQRREMYQQNTYELELAKCAAMNTIYAHEAYEGPASSKQFYARHKQLQELYEQQRVERTSLWKDVSRLRLALPESAQAYLAAHRKMQALNSATGDPP